MNLSFEICKKLKDAGYPQNTGAFYGNTIGQSDQSCWRIQPKDSDPSMEWVAAPELSELLNQLPPRIISTRDDSFISEPESEEEWTKVMDQEGNLLLWFSLDVVSERGQRDGWVATYASDNVSFLDAEAKTPDEAAALMYLKLKELRVI